MEGSELLIQYWCFHNTNSIIVFMCTNVTGCMFATGLSTMHTYSVTNGEDCLLSEQDNYVHNGLATMFCLITSFNVFLKF